MIRVGTRAHENPFRVECVRALDYRPEGTTWAAILARLERERCRGAVVGPHGAGKTTFLAALASRLESPWEPRLLFTNQDDRGHVPAAWDLSTGARGARTLLLVDGYDLLGWSARRQLLRAARGAAGIVVTRHRGGGISSWPTLHRCAPTPETLAWIAEALAPRSVDRSEVADLFAAHRGNIRTALRALYDRWADGPGGACTMRGPRLAPSA